MSAAEARLVARLRAARRDPTVALLEGLHAFKHAVRFGAEIEAAVSPEPDAVAALARDLAPDILPALGAHLRPCSPATFEAAAARPPETGLLAVARRPDMTAIDTLARRDRPAVVLHEPRHPGNLGAVIRVAAALDAAGVLIVGSADPWSPAAIRGAAGLQFALPCARGDALDLSGRRCVAFAVGGEALAAIDLPADAALVFGGERHGLPDGWLQRADRVATIAMRPGVSSLNLATAVAIGLGHAVGR